MCAYKPNNPLNSKKSKTQPHQANTALSQNAVLVCVVACFLLSGFAALLYQTAWLRLFSIAFGTSEIAVITVLAAYMSGLAAGAAVADRWLGKIRRPIFVYAILEAGIAVSALTVPFLLQFSEWFYVALLGGQAELPDSTGTAKSIFYLAVGFIVLALPTGFMGATLPLLTRYAVRSNEQVGPRVALLYAVNTLGAVFGTLFAAFLLLPHLGLLGTVWVGVLINFAVFLIAARLSKITIAEQLHTDEPQIEQTDEDIVSSRLGFYQSCIKPWFARAPLPEKLGTLSELRAAWILPIICMSGFVSFAYEVLWTRMLSHVLGGSIYAFATMLASFLAGIALGSAFAGKFSRNPSQAAAAFVLAQIGIAVASIVVYISLDRLIPNEFDFLSRVVFAISAMLPATFFIGTTFPLAVRILCPDEKLTGNATARVYAWNTSGAILGAIFAGFWLIPSLGFSGTVYSIVLTNLALACVVAVVLASSRSILASIAGVAFFAVVFMFSPQRPDDLVNASYVNAGSHIDHHQRGRELYYAVGRSATVLLKEEDGHFFLRTNGLPEATIMPRGSIAEINPQHWLTALPALARPEAEDMLVIGLGGGVALESVPPSVKHIDVVELEPEVVSANDIISDQRNRNPLGDPRTRIVTNDARGALALTDKRYDIIVSQPSHPWTAGASHLYTREFMDIARRHLKEDGVFLQWINWQYLDEALLKSLTATLQDAFTNVRMYQHSPSVLHFIASDSHLNIEQVLSEDNNALERQSAHFESIGALTLEDVAYALTLDEAGVKSLSAGAPVTTDNHNRLAVNARVFREDGSDSGLYDVLADHLVYTRPDSAIRQMMGKTLSLPRVIERMLGKGLLAQVKLIAPTIDNPAEQLLVEALVYKHQGNTDAMDQALWQAYELDPKNENIVFLLIRSSLGSLSRGQATPEIQTLVQNTTGILQAIASGWQLAAINEWQQLSSLDFALSIAKPDNLWFASASQLRAQWRIQASRATGNTELTQEATTIISRALAIDYNYDLVLMRLVASSVLFDEPAVLFAANLVANKTEERIRQAQKGSYQFDRDNILNSERQLMFIVRFLRQNNFSSAGQPRAQTILTKLERQLSELGNFGS